MFAFYLLKTSTVSVLNFVESHFYFFLFRCEDYIFVLMMVRLPINF